MVGAGSLPGGVGGSTIGGFELGAAPLFGIGGFGVGSGEFIGQVIIRYFIVAKPDIGYNVVVYLASACFAQYDYFFTQGEEEKCMIRFLPGQHPLPYFKPLQFWIIVLVISMTAASAVAGALYLHQFRNQFYPGIIIDSVPVGGLTADQARSVLQKQVEEPEFLVTVRVDDIAIASSSSQLGIHKNIDKSIQNGISYAKNGWWTTRLLAIVMMQFEPQEYSSEWAFEASPVVELLQTLQSRVAIPSQEPSAVLGTSGALATLDIKPGEFGREIELTKAQSMIIPPRDLIATEWEVPVASTGSQLTTDQVIYAKERAGKLVGDTMTIKGPDVTFRLNDQALIKLLAFPSGFSDQAFDEILTTWAKEINRPAQDAVFTYDAQTLAVNEFKPHRDGLAVDQDESKRLLMNKLQILEENVEENSSDETNEVTLVVSTTPPAATLASTNDLGINERIGFGDSEYDHSIPNRIHNVALTSQKINLTIVKPGAEFSFNKTLGDVSTATGFRQAYIIKDGQTVLGDGGGVCQVSTTLFRSVLNAGLPITKRKAHSYRVSYYELDRKPGVDATVYAGDVDLRFVNDTGHHILIFSQADSQNLDMQIEIYGTSDGRTTEIVDHKTWDARPAPAPVLIPDPSLAPGQRKQIDFAASGIRASFTNVVKDKQGKIIRSDTYVSNYVPWAAKYLVGP